MMTGTPMMPNGTIMGQPMGNSQMNNMAPMRQQQNQVAIIETIVKRGLTIVF